MKIRKLLQLLILIQVTSCNVSDSTFLNYYEVNTPLTSASLEISAVGKSQPIIAKINPEFRIYGVGNGKRFYSDDLFNTVDFLEGFASYGYHEIDGTIVNRTVYDDDLYQIVIEESYDYGYSFEVKSRIEKVFNDDFVYFAESKNTGWLILDYFDKVNIIKVSGNSNQLMATINGKRPKSIWMNGQNGYILVDANFEGDKKDIYRTIDGGKSWNYNSTIDLKIDSGNTLYDINYVKGYEDLIYAYNDASPNNGYTSNASASMYISRDSGNSWEFFNQNNLSSFQFLDNRNGYAIQVISYVQNWEEDKIASIGNIFKTTDAGISWIEVSNKEIYGDRIYFLNSDIGLAMSYSVLQITFNGGKDWELLIYPLESID